MDTKITRFDGTDEIIFSDSFNIYRGELIISDLFGYKFKFKFETNEPRKDQQDITSKLEDKEIVVTLSKKFRNSLGSMTTEKLPILKSDEGKHVLLSIFGQQIGSESLHITVNFYLR